VALSEFFVHCGLLRFWMVGQAHEVRHHADRVVEEVVGRSDAADELAEQLEADHAEQL
jgi:hypothetical protein